MHFEFSMCVKKIKINVISCIFNKSWFIIIDNLPHGMCHSLRRQILENFVILEKKMFFPACLNILIFLFFVVFILKSTGSTFTQFIDFLGGVIMQWKNTNVAIWNSRNVTSETYLWELACCLTNYQARSLKIPMFKPSPCFAEW